MKLVNELSFCTTWFASEFVARRARRRVEARTEIATSGFATVLVELTEEVPPEIVYWKTGGVLKTIATAGIRHGDVNGHIPGPSGKVSFEEFKKEATIEYHPFAAGEKHPEEKEGK